MKAIKKEINTNGNVILTCEISSYWGLVKKEVKFIATSEYPRGYWDWRELPDKKSIDTYLSFQLNSWCKDFSS